MRWRWLIGLTCSVCLLVECGRPAIPRAAAAEQGGAESSSSGTASKSAADDDEKIVPIEKSDAEWKRQLTPKQFRVTRQAATEEAFTGRYVHTKRPGTYHCVCCDLDLFSSQAKFDSHTGWPSYWAPLKVNRVKLAIDTSDPLEIRTEVRCARCGAHLGHVFDDGPPPTGLRYCMNSAALKLEETPAAKSKSAAAKKKAK